MHFLFRSKSYPILCCIINYAGANCSFATTIPISQLLQYQQNLERTATTNEQKQLLPQKFNFLSDNWQYSHKIWKKKRDEMKRKNVFDLRNSLELELLQQHLVVDQENSKFQKQAFSNMISSSFYPRQDQSSYKWQNWQPQRRIEKTHGKFISNFGFPHPQRAPIGRLFNPQDEIKKISTIMNRFLLEEYLRSYGSKESLDKILKWAEKMRQKGMEKTPILLLIHRLNWRQETRPFIMPLYISFLKTPEAKMFKDRPQLLLPAIVHAFNAKNPIKAVNSINNQISKVLECYTPDGVETIRKFMQIQFRIFIHKMRMQKNKRNSTAICAIKIKEMASALRQSGCYPTPLTDTFVFSPLFDYNSSKEWKLEMFRVFVEEPTERKLFTGRPHIFFPLLLEKFRNRNSDRWVILSKMFHFLIHPIQQRQTTPMPNFMVEFVENRLGKLFSIACNCGQFELAKRILDYTNKFEGEKQFNFNISPTSLLKYWLHLWMNGRLLNARVVGERLHERIYWLKESEKYGKNKEQQKQLDEWRNLQKRLNSMNKCFRELMENPQTNNVEREKYAKLFIGILLDQIS